MPSARKQLRVRDEEIVLAAECYATGAAEDCVDRPGRTHLAYARIRRVRDEQVAQEVLATP